MYNKYKEKKINLGNKKKKLILNKKGTEREKEKRLLHIPPHPYSRSLRGY